jgi:Mn-containing catalase
MVDPQYIMENIMLDGVSNNEFANEYISRQGRVITELVNKNIMLETQVALLQKKLDELTKDNNTEQKDDY